MEHPELPEPPAVVHRGGQDRECSYSRGRQETQLLDLSLHAQLMCDLSERVSSFVEGHCR